MICTARHFQPSPLLRQHISRLALYTFPQAVRQPFLPVGQQSLVFALGPAFRLIGHAQEEQTAARATVVGQITSLRHSFFEAGSQYLLVKFTPCGFHDLFACSMQKLTNEGTDLCDIAGAPARELLNRLQDLAAMAALPHEGATGEDQRLCAAVFLVEQFLVRRLAGSTGEVLRTQQMAGYMAAMKGDFRMEAFCREVNITRKSLERHFLERIGITPKVYARILRMTHVMDMVRSNHAVRPRELIYTCGYYDYAHLRHETLELTGMTPRVLREVFVRL